MDAVPRAWVEARPGSLYERIANSGVETFSWKAGCRIPYGISQSHW